MTTTIQPEILADVRAQFPALRERIHGHPLVYLDSAASTHKPQRVVDAMVASIEHAYSNVHRGAHTLSERATNIYEDTRVAVDRFLTTPASHVSLYTAGATAAINLIAYSYGLTQLQRGDTILLTIMEHHSNYVPWLMVAQKTGATLKVVPTLADGSLDMQDLRAKLDASVRLVAISHISNVLGTRNDIKTIIELAHNVGAVVAVDGAQAVADIPVNLSVLNPDFYCWSGHKLYGPTGIGILTARRSLLEKMPPFLHGGAMIETVEVDRFSSAPLPYKFEAGTPPIIEAAGLQQAIAFVSELTCEAIARHKATLLAATREQCASIPGLRELGTVADKSGIFSFVVDGAHPHDIATLLDQQGIAVRAGHHCAEPLMRQYGITGTTRVSFGVYNTLDDVARLSVCLKNALRLLLR